MKATNNEGSMQDYFGYISIFKGMETIARNIALSVNWCGNDAQLHSIKNGQYISRCATVQESKRKGLIIDNKTLTNTRKSLKNISKPFEWLLSHSCTTSNCIKNARL